jgi:peptidoglycan/LPS O-acetylase OafA/YrhL
MNNTRAVLAACVAVAAAVVAVVAAIVVQYTHSKSWWLILIVAGFAVLIAALESFRQLGKPDPIHPSTHK